MGSWTDNTQSVELDGSSSVRHRVVYSVRDVPEQKVQFGTVKVDYGTVAVWRPFDPDDKGADASWRNGVWRNVYRIKVPQHPIPNRPKYVQYGVEEVTVGEVCAKLPVAELQVSYQLQEHLRST